jgi:cyanophycin synthetase
VGLVSTSGLVIDGRRVRAIEALDPAGVATLLNNPTTETVVAQVDAGQIVDHGLGFDYCDVALVLSLSGIATPFAKPVETVLTESLSADGTLVLNTGDPASACLATDRDRLPVLFALDSDNERVRNHREHGGRSVVVRRASTGDTISLIETDAIIDLFPATMPAIAADLPEESSSLVLLAVVAAAIARDVPLDAIRRALA